jgi:hypothetical protein
MKKIIGIPILFGSYYIYCNHVKKYYPYFKLINKSNNIKSDEIILYNQYVNFTVDNNTMYNAYKIVKEFDNNYLIIDYSKPMIKINTNNNELIKFFNFFKLCYKKDEYNLDEDYTKYYKYFQPKTRHELLKDEKLFNKECKKNITK